MLRYTSKSKFASVKHKYEKAIFITARRLEIFKEILNIWGVD